MTELFTAETTLVNDSTDIGFGVGEKAEYRFDEVRLSSPSLSAEEPSKLTEYVYDALGRRVAMTDYVGASAYTTRYLYAGNRIIEELDGDNNLRASYVYGLYVDEVLQMRRDTYEGTAGMGDHYYLHDDLYNVLALTDGGGNVLERYGYGDYGAPTIADPAGVPRPDSDHSAYSNPFLFNGRQYDETTGFYYYRTRYMEPLMGRFISRDTIGLWGDANNLGNPYTYAGNNPWSNLDPFGEGPEDRFGTDDYITEATYTLGSMASGLAKNTWAGIKGTGAGIYWWLFAGDEAHQEAALRVLAGSVEVLNDPGTAATSAASSAWAGAKGYGNSLLDTPASSGDSVSQAMLFAGAAAAPYAKLGSLTELGGLANLGKVTTKTDDVFVLKRGLGDATTSPWLADPRVGVRSHIESFRDGSSFLLPERGYNEFILGKEKIGRPGEGIFVLRRDAMDRLLRESGGDLTRVKQMLGIPDEFWNDKLIRIDIDNPLLHNARMPTGLEEGANELFRWGGYTSGGFPELLIDEVPAGAFRATPTGIGP